MSVWGLTNAVTQLIELVAGGGLNMVVNNGRDRPRGRRRGTSA
jgi:hypothetical protein